jgi:hypothetical protein
VGIGAPAPLTAIQYAAAVSDDWRLHLVLADHGEARHLAKLLATGEVEHRLDDGFSERVIVSVDGPELFAYSGSREQAEQASAAIAEACRQHAWRVDEERLQRWHPVAEAWEDPDTPLPASEQEAEAERAELMAEEREESAAEGYPEWEVQVECHTDQDTIALSKRLDDEGLRHVRRHRFLLLGANDEDSARRLAQRLEGEIPAGSLVTVQGTLEVVAGRLPANPFAVFGGLGA